MFTWHPGTHDDAFPGSSHDSQQQVGAPNVGWVIGAVLEPGHSGPERRRQSEHICGGEGHVRLWCVWFKWLCRCTQCSCRAFHFCESHVPLQHGSRTSEAWHGNRAPACHSSRVRLSSRHCFVAARHHFTVTRHSLAVARHYFRGLSQHGRARWSCRVLVQHSAAAWRFSATWRGIAAAWLSCGMLHR